MSRQTQHVLDYDDLLLYWAQTMGDPHSTMPPVWRNVFAASSSVRACPAARLTDALKPNLGCFAAHDVEKKTEQCDNVKIWRINGIDKGALVDPPMSDQSHDVIRIAVDEFPKWLGNHVWSDFWKDGTEVVEIDESAYPQGYWNAVLRSVEQVGFDPALLVPYEPIGESISRWQYGQGRCPDFIEIKRLARKPSGGGIAYEATVNGLDVFLAQFNADHSYLFSTRKLQSIIHRWVERDKFVTAEFEEGNDPSRGTIVIRFSQETRWRSTRTIQFVLTKSA
jgi:hypothetical protein